MARPELATILVVDDEQTYRVLLSEVLQEAGFAAAVAADGPTALQLAARRSYDLAILDLMMPGMDGRELMRRLRERDPDLPVVFLTAHGSIPSAVEAIKEGAADFLTKPLPHIDDFVLTVRRVLDAQRLRRDNRALLAAAQPADPFPTRDPAVLALLDKARKLAAAEITVLVTGESGAGKEHLARFPHQHGARTQRPLVTVNCAAIPENLIESELFGHERGAFTGAGERRLGRFEEAHGSTLFLDEIGELPLAMQPKLLRVLQERELRRVGGDRVVRVDTRIIAATNRDLREEVAAGRFREDLFYRLTPAILRVPALRERPVDVMFLAEQFVAAAAARARKPVPTLTAAAQERLARHGWPGNVRELANIIEVSVLLADGPRIDADALHGLEERSAPAASAASGSGQGGVVSADLLGEAERATIVGVLARCAGNRRQAAEQLGMSLRNLQYKLKKFGISGRSGT